MVWLGVRLNRAVPTEHCLDYATFPFQGGIPILGGTNCDKGVLTTLGTSKRAFDLLL